MPKTIYAEEYLQIANKLRNARKEAGYTQLEASKKLLCVQSYISKVESGEQRIDILELKKFAKLYKKSVSNFI